MLEEFALGLGVYGDVEEDDGFVCEVGGQGGGEFDPGGVVGEAAVGEFALVGDGERGEIALERAAVEAGFLQCAGEGSGKAGESGGFAEVGEVRGGGYAGGEGFARDAADGDEATAAEFFAGGAMDEVAEAVAVDCGEDGFAEFEGELAGGVAVGGQDEDASWRVQAEEVSCGLSQLGVGGQVPV